MEMSTTWPFCPQCGTILDPPAGEHVQCQCCPFKCRFYGIHIPEIITKSAPTPKPSWIDEENEQTESKAIQKHASIEEPCPKCGNPELYFYTMQLRSVDEGSTVFYECPNCKYKYSVNN